MPNGSIASEHRRFLVNLGDGNTNSWPQENGRRAEKREAFRCLFLWWSCAPTLDDALSERHRVRLDVVLASLPPLPPRPIITAVLKLHEMKGCSTGCSIVPGFFASLRRGIAFMHPKWCFVWPLAPVSHVSSISTVGHFRVRYVVHEKLNHTRRQASNCKRSKMEFTQASSNPLLEPTLPTAPTCCSIPNQKGSATTKGSSHNGRKDTRDT